MQLIFRATLSLVLLAAFSAGASAQYSKEPLRGAPILDLAEWLVEATYTNNWLNDNWPRLTDDQAIAIRERLFLLVDVAVRRRFQNTGTTDVEHDDVAATLVPALLDWAGRLGILGTDLIVADMGAAPAGPTPVPGPEYELAYEAPLLSVGTVSGTWTAEFPFYFMLSHVGRVATDGQESDVLVVSTLFAPHTGQSGESQSTLMFVFSAQERQTFRTGWLSRLGLTDAAPTASDLADGAESYRGADPQSPVQVEAVFWDVPAGSVAVVYTGLPGPFEANHAALQDFVRNLAF